MKISKLFHWLYAILMLLPAFAIGVTCLYVIFNKNAYQSYNDNNITTLVNSNNDFKINEKYHFQLNSYNYTNDNNKRVSFTQIDNWVNTYNTFSEEQANACDSFSLTYYSDYSYIVFYTNNVQTIALRQNVSFDFILVSYSYNNNLYTFNESFDNSFYKYDYNNSLDNVFYYSIDKVQESPLFNWAYDSFLASPITYITRLFGMPDNNIAILLMSYWLDISIIYLVFDLIMYVPLLVHRWLDKGVLE